MTEFLATQKNTGTGFTGTQSQANSVFIERFLSKLSRIGRCHRRTEDVATAQSLLLGPGIQRSSGPEPEDKGHSGF